MSDRSRAGEARRGQDRGFSPSDAPVWCARRPSNNGSFSAADRRATVGRTGERNWNGWHCVHTEPRTNQENRFFFSSFVPPRDPSRGGFLCALGIAPRPALTLLVIENEPRQWKVSARWFRTNRWVEILDPLGSRFRTLATAQRWLVFTPFWTLSTSLANPMKPDAGPFP